MNIAAAAVGKIFVLAIQIYDNAQKLKQNKSQALLLAQRIKMIANLIKNIKEINNNAHIHYNEQLNNLIETIYESKELIDNLTIKPKGIYAKAKFLYKAQINKEKLIEQEEKLRKNMDDLNIGMQAQQIFDKKQSDENIKADFEIIKQHQMKELSKKQLSSQAIADIVARQILSMQRKDKEINNSSTSIEVSKLRKSLLISYDELDFKSQISKSSLGSTYKGNWQYQPVIIKLIENPLEPSVKEYFLREVQIMSRLKSQFIVQIYGMCWEKGLACVVMEYLPGGKLSELLAAGSIAPSLQKSIALEIAKGINYLHSRGIIHRNLQPEAILLDGSKHAKLSEFSKAKINSHSVMSATDISTNFNNNLIWRAPELLVRGNIVKPSADIYSYGAILWSLFKRKIPTSNIDLENLENLPYSIAELIKHCCNAKPYRRPDIVQIIEDITNYRPRPDSPNAKTLYNNGIQFEEKKNYINAVMNYQRAIKKGYDKACTNLGMLYLLGKGNLRVDKKEALRLLEKGAASGHDRAMFNLGYMYEKGDGVVLDKRASIRWYTKAKQAGNLNAERRISRLKNQQS